MKQQIGVRRARYADIDALAGITLDCVTGGASIGFMQDFSLDDAIRFWQGCLDSAAEGKRIILVATDPAGTALGTVQLVFAVAVNQPHRADVAKLQVSPSERRRGIAAVLMESIENEAQAMGRWLLVLDTVSGSEADSLYRRLGWVAIGEIPDYALWPDGKLCPTTVFYKQLSPRHTCNPASSG